MGSFRIIFRAVQGPHLPTHSFTNISSRRKKITRSRGRDKLRNTERPQVQPSDGNVPPVAGQQAGIRPEFQQQGRRRHVCTSNVPFPGSTELSSGCSRKWGCSTTSGATYGRRATCWETGRKYSLSATKSRPASPPRPATSTATLSSGASGGRAATTTALRRRYGLSYYDSRRCRCHSR